MISMDSRATRDHFWYYFHQNDVQYRIIWFGIALASYVGNPSSTSKINKLGLGTLTRATGDTVAVTLTAIRRIPLTSFYYSLTFTNSWHYFRTNLSLSSQRWCGWHNCYGGPGISESTAGVHPMLFWFRLRSHLVSLAHLPYRNNKADENHFD